MRVIVPSTGTLPESWRVRLPIFEGPLDLLLDLIRIHEVEIAELPVAPICDQFHEYLQLMEELNLDIAGDYIYMAAYLIHLKSRMLLPQPKDELTGDPEEDPRQDLVERLLEYRRLKEAAQTLAEVDSVRRGLWSRKSHELRRLSAAEPSEMDISEVSLFDLLRTFRSVLDRFEREHPEPLRLLGETFSVRDQIHRLLSRLDAGRPVHLVDDLRCLSGRREAIAAFLGILEMTRMRLIRLHRNEDGSVLVYRTEKELDQLELEAIQA